jgi:succinate-acetate transporter protein
LTNLFRVFISDLPAKINLFRVFISLSTLSSIISSKAIHGEEGLYLAAGVVIRS